MAMTAGTVSVTDAGAVTKSGVAGEVYDQLIAGMLSEFGLTSPTGPSGAAQKRGYAVMANAVAKVVTHILANAQLQVQAADANLQKDSALAFTTAPGANTTFGKVL